LVRCDDKHKQNVILDPRGLYVKYLKSKNLPILKEKYCLKNLDLLTKEFWLEMVLLNYKIEDFSTLTDKSTFDIH
jgi:hypothetical protein